MLRLFGVGASAEKKGPFYFPKQRGEHFIFHILWWQRGLRAMENMFLSRF